MSKQSIIHRLDMIKTKLELIEADAEKQLEGMTHKAIDLAWEAVCHALDLAQYSREIPFSEVDDE